jgi:hypothetical protein
MRQAKNLIKQKLRVHQEVLLVDVNIFAVRCPLPSFVMKLVSHQKK